MDEEFDKTDFEAHVGLPITDEQFEAFKLLYRSGCFMDWPDFAKKAQLIVKQLYLPGTECCLEEEKRRLRALYKKLPYGYIREDVLEIYLFLDTMEMWHTQNGVIFRNEHVDDYMIETFRGVDGVCISQEDLYATVELDINTLTAFCKSVSDMSDCLTGRLKKEVNDGKE